jgi:low affinity Fe/Cu permease
MDAGWATVFAAAISAVGAVMVVLLQRARKENKRDHEVVQGILRMMYRGMQRTEDKVDKVADKLAEHIEEHHRDSQDA